MTTVEFRTRKTPDTPWELSPVRHSVKYRSSDLDLTPHINNMAQVWANTWGEEVRWNFEGSTQGHYVSPKG